MVYVRCTVKKIFFIFTTILLMLTLCMGASASVSDGAELLGAYDAQSLEARLSDISSRYGTEVIVYTTNDYTSSPANAARQQLSTSGIVFFVSMAERDWYIYASDTYLFNDAAFDMMEDSCVPLLSSGDYSGAFSRFADIVEEVLELDAQGESYRAPRKLSHLLIGLGVALVIALAAAGITVGVLRSQLTSVHMQRGADSYQNEGSLNITQSHERFLYKNVTRVPRPKSNGGHGGGGGGGGRGGKF